MKNNKIVWVCLLILFSFCGCSEQNSEAIKPNTNEESLTEYKLIYFDPIQDQYYDKAILLSDEGVEAQIIYELFKKENISEVLYDQLKME